MIRPTRPAHAGIARPGRRWLAVLAAALLLTALLPLAGAGPAQPAGAQEADEAPTDGVFVYVANTGDHTVSVIDTATSEVVATVTLGSANQAPALGVAARCDGARVYVTHGDKLSMFDTATHAKVPTISGSSVHTVATGLTGLAAEPNRWRLYAVASPGIAQGRVVPVDILQDDRPGDHPVNGPATTVGDAPTGVVVHPDSHRHRAYATNSGEDSVSVLDTATDPLTVVATVAVGEAPTGLAVAADGRRLYVANSGDGTLSVVDTATDEVVDTIAVGTAPLGAAAAEDGSRVYVANSGDGTVSVIDTDSDQVVATVAVGVAPVAVAVHHDGHTGRAYVANGGDHTVSVIDTASYEVVGTIDVGVAPTGLAAVDRSWDCEPPPPPPPPPDPCPHDEPAPAGPVSARSPGPGASDEGLVEIGVLPGAFFHPWPQPQVPWCYGPHWAYQEGAPPATMVVDPVNRLGFAYGWKWGDPLGWTRHGDPNNSRAGRLFMYDLETLELVDRALGFPEQDLSAGRLEQLDSMLGVPILPLGAGADGEGLLLRPESYKPGLVLAPSTCGPGSQSIEAARYLRQESGAWTMHPSLEDRVGVQSQSDPVSNDPPGHPALPGWGLRGSDVSSEFVPGTEQSTLTVPCASGFQTFFLTGATHLPESGAPKLYTLEVPRDTETQVRQNLGINPIPAVFTDVMNRAGQTTLLRQYDLDALLAGTPDQALDWEIDLTLAGCESYHPHPRPRATYWVARVSDAVLTYCYDHRAPGLFRVPGAEGLNGYVVRIPLTQDAMPHPRPGFPTLLTDPTSTGGKRLVNAMTRRIPTLAGPVVPFADALTGRVLLATNDAVNGTAVWVLDPVAERFVGVGTHGFTATELDQHPGKNAVGFDPASGRVYVFGPEGMLVVDGRQPPPLTGQLVRVLTHPDDIVPYRVRFGSAAQLATVERLAVVNIDGTPRVIVPIVGRGYVVLEDRIAFPEPHEPTDADRLTEQVAEVEGRTGANHMGAGQASGAHVVVAGGAPRAVNQLSPTCAGTSLEEDPTVAGAVVREVGTPSERNMLEGECLAEQFLASGHREVFFANSDVEAGSWSGAEAEAQSVSFVRADAATDHDLRSASQCYRHDVRYVGEQGVDWMARGGQESGDDDAKPSEDMAALFDGLFGTGFDPDDPDADEDVGGYGLACAGPQQGVAQATDAAPFVDRVDLSYGTAGDADGRGFPAPVAMCQDGGGNPGGEGAEGPLEALTSTVACNGAIPAAQAGSAAAALVLPGAEDPLVVVEKVSSRIVSRRIVADVAEFTDKALQLTRAEAVASGIQIGPVRIGEVRTFAEVRAGGRGGTTSAVLTREWCDVTFPDAEILVGCREVAGPFDPLVEAVRDELAQAFPRLRISVPEASLTASEGGAQAVVTKHAGLRAADDTVNDDDSFIVPALEVLILNDGAEGRNRYLVHLAGVHAEARYTINSIPQFDFPIFDPSPSGDPVRPAPPPDDTGGFDGLFAAPDGDTPPPPGVDEGAEGFVPGQPGRPPRYEEIVELASGGSDVAGPQVASPLRRVLMAPGEVLKSAWRWLVQNPVEFGLLLVVFSILAIPVYLAQRRRTFEHALGEPR